MASGKPPFTISRSHDFTISPRSGRLALGELLGGGNPVVSRDAPSEVERSVERLGRLRIEIGDLPEVVDADIVEPLFQLDVDSGQALQVVGLAARRVDAPEGRLLRRHGQLLDWRLLRRAHVDARLRLAALDAVDGSARHEVAIERDGAAGI